MYRYFALVLVIFALVQSARCADNVGLDWATWRHMPVFGEGRVAPLETFARETVETICGRPDPTLTLPGARPRKFMAAELIFSWLADPNAWETVPFLVAADARLREDIMRLPLVDDQGRRLGFISPAEVENNPGLGQRWADLQQRADAEGKAFRPAGIDKKIKALVDAYERFRLLTYQPGASHDAPRRFYARVRSAADAWRKLAGALQNAKTISKDDDIRRQMVEASEALQKLIGQMHGGTLSREKVEAPAAAFCRVSEQLAARLDKSDDKPLAALATNLRRQTTEMRLAMYDNGGSLSLVPSLNPGALEENREPGDDAAPWLSFQAMIYGSDDVMRPFPQTELKAVRKAWADVKAAYLDRGAADRPAKFGSAMDQFAQAVRSFGEQIEPLRQKLPIYHRDQELITTTAYPPSGATDIEVFYNRLDPFFWSWVISLIATLCLLFAVGRLQRTMFWLGVAVLVAAQAFTAVGMAIRGYLTSLVPLTGMFETVVFVAFYSSMLGLWFSLRPLWRSANKDLAAEDGNGQGIRNGSPQTTNSTRMDRVLQRRLFAVAGAMVGFIAAVLAYYAPATVMHRNIGSITPILRDNFWLAVHVVTIMASYASAAIALILGNIALGYYLFGRYRSESSSSENGARKSNSRRPSEACHVLAGFTYTAIQITVLLLAAGTILGALWADKAWGRFWAWDPKEVWALISLLVYLLILHARAAGWARDFGMAMAAVLGATAVLFTWYGVNFLLGSGMHSYGTGAGGQWEVGSAVAIQWLFLMAAAGRYRFETVGRVHTQ